MASIKLTPKHQTRCNKQCYRQNKTNLWNWLPL